MPENKRAVFRYNPDNQLVTVTAPNHQEQQFQISALTHKAAEIFIFAGLSYLAARLLTDASFLTAALALTDDRLEKVLAHFYNEGGKITSNEQVMIELTQVLPHQQELFLEAA